MANSSGNPHPHEQPMTTTTACPDVGFPKAVADAVRAAVETTYAAIAGEKPVLSAAEHPDCACVAGIISFVGESTWTLSWFLTKDIAPALAKTFTGIDILFDSSDMGDVAGELVNVLAGEVVAQLEKRRINAKMSLPTVVRGNPLELMPAKGPGMMRMDFTTRQGGFWLRLAVACKGQGTQHRLPGT